MVMPPGGNAAGGDLFGEQFGEARFGLLQCFGAGGWERRSEGCRGCVGDGRGIDVGKRWGLRVGVEGAERSEG